MTWHSRARAAMDQLIAEGDPFTADDLLELVGHPDTEHTANGRNSAVGSMFSAYSGNGLIEVCGTASSRAAHRKGGLIRVWKPRFRQLTIYDELAG